MERTKARELLETRGYTLEPDRNLGEFTTLGVGGCPWARVRPQAAGDLPELLSFLRKNQVPVRIMGGGSNLLASDGELAFVVLQIRGLDEGLDWHPDHCVVGADVMMPRLAKASQKEGRQGLEWMAGVPGCVGGGVVMNAGAWGADVSSCLLWADVVWQDGTCQRVSEKEAGYSYRHSILKNRAVVLGAAFRAEPGETQQIAKRMAEITAQRTQTQPQSIRTGGSTYKNPPNEKAGRLLEQAGMKDLRIGDISFSEGHANFLVNHGGATFSDTLALLEEAELRVQKKFGVELERELVIWT